MACRLVGAKQLSEPMLEKTSVKFQSSIFIQENPFERVVCEMVASLSRSQCNNWAQHWHWICNILQWTIISRPEQMSAILKRHHDVTGIWYPTHIYQHRFSEIRPLTNLTNPIMHLFHNPQCTIQNKNVRISVLSVELWDMGQVHCGVCEFVIMSLHVHPTVFSVCYN